VRRLATSVQPTHRPVKRCSTVSPLPQAATRRSGEKGICIPLKARTGERFIAHVLPMTSGARRKVGMFYSAVATVFVHKAVLSLPSPPVTPAELRVLFAIIEVGGVPEVADMLGTSEATVKSTFTTSSRKRVRPARPISSS
jgi:hypothetical protein